jgi:hypothetical protein
MAISPAFCATIAWLACSTISQKAKSVVTAARSKTRVRPMMIAIRRKGR